jgi:hypothetical protein
MGKTVTWRSAPLFAACRTFSWFYDGVFEAWRHFGYL